MKLSAIRKLILSAAVIAVINSAAMMSALADANQICVTQNNGIYGGGTTCTDVEQTSILSSEMIYVSIVVFVIGLAAVAIANASKLIEGSILATDIA